MCSTKGLSFNSLGLVKSRSYKPNSTNRSLQKYKYNLNTKTYMADLWVTEGKGNLSVGY